MTAAAEKPKLTPLEQELLAALKALLRDCREYERVNNLAPNPGHKDCWQSETDADAAILKAEGKQP